MRQNIAMDIVEKSLVCRRYLQLSNVFARVGSCSRPLNDVDGDVESATNHDDPLGTIPQWDRSLLHATT